MEIRVFSYFLAVVQEEGINRGGGDFAGAYSKQCTGMEKAAAIQFGSN